jgi:hypothetical protein
MSDEQEGKFNELGAAINQIRAIKLLCSVRTGMFKDDVEMLRKNLTEIRERCELVRRPSMTDYEEGPDSMLLIALEHISAIRVTCTFEAPTAAEMRGLLGTIENGCDYVLGRGGYGIEYEDPTKPPTSTVPWKKYDKVVGKHRVTFQWRSDDPTITEPDITEYDDSDLWFIPNRLKELGWQGSIDDISVREIDEDGNVVPQNNEEMDATNWIPTNSADLRRPGGV